MDHIGAENEDVIENYLNGRYKEFQTQIARIGEYLKYDMFFGNKINNFMKQIRKKAIIQYVSPYKVIDLREIAKAFDLTVEQIEKEVADLIVTR